MRPAGASRGQSDIPPMTAIVVTLTSDRAWLTADGAFAGCPLSIWAQGQFEEAARRYGHLSLPSFASRGAGRKLMAFSEARMALATTGTAAAACCLGAEASMMTDIDALAAALPDIWRSIPAAGRNSGAAIIAVGWNERSGRAIGFSASAVEGMVARPMEDGSCWTPDPCEDVPGAADIRRLLDADDVEALHFAVVTAQAWGARRGRYGVAGICIGGDITMASVDASGITLKRIGHIQIPEEMRASTTIGAIHGVGRPEEADLLRGLGFR